MKFFKKTILFLSCFCGLIFIYLKSNCVTPNFFKYHNVSNVDRLEKDMTAILNTSKPRNYQNIDELNQVADYIRTEFLKVSDSIWVQEYEADGKIYKNIICSINTNKSERVIIGAHYDVCGDQYGADDNASGVVGVLELARMLKDSILPYRIDFVAYTLEEPPYFNTEKMGSFIHAKYLFDNKTPVKGMISLEMIGYFSDMPNSQDYPIPLLKYVYGDKGDFITIVQNMSPGKFAIDISKSMMSYPKIKTILFRAPQSLPGIDFSDHRNYWNYDFSSIMITNTAFYRNKNYHQNTDNIVTLDFNKMGLVIDEVYWGLLKL